MAVMGLNLLIVQLTCSTIGLILRVPELKFHDKFQVQHPDRCNIEAGFMDMSTKTYRKNCTFAENHAMEKSFEKKIKGIRFHYKIWLSDKGGQGILGDGKWKILKLIEEKGSIMAACDELGWTYRRTWGNLKKIEIFFGFPLLEKHRGGNDGGTTRLTPEGKKLVRAFDSFHASADSVIAKGFEKLIKDLAS